MDPKLRLVTSETAAPARELNANERAAAEVLALLEEIAARIPRLTGPSAEKNKRIRGARTVPREYVLAMLDTAETQLDDTLVLQTLDPADARDTVEFNAAFRPVARRLAVLLQSLNFTMAARWTDVVGRALKAYGMAKATSELPGNETLAAELELVAKELNRKGKKKRKKG